MVGKIKGKKGNAKKRPTGSDGKERRGKSGGETSSDEV